MTIKTGKDKETTEQPNQDDKVKSNNIIEQEWLEKAPTPIFYKDHDGRYLGCNRAFEEFMNIEKKSIIGKTVHEVWPERYASIYKDKDIELIKNGGNQTYEFQIETSKGEIRDVIFHKAIFQNSDGTVGGLIGSILDISDRKVAEKALIEKKELYHAMFENTRAIKLLIDPSNDNIVDANSAAAIFYGYSLEELKSMKIFEINKLTPEQIKEEMAKALSEDKDYFNFQHKLADGKIRDVEVYSSPIEINGQILLHSIIHDITLRKEAEDLLRRDEQRFKLMFMNAPMPYQSLDEKGNILDVNQAYLDALGYTREELIGKNFGDILHPDWVDHFKENFPKFKAVGEILGVEFQMLKKDGETILVFFNGKVQRDIKGGFQRTHCVFQDITKQKKAEIERVESETRNLHIKKSESLGRMAGSIAHHYNNMLAVVIGNLELAMEQVQDKMNPTEEISEAINAARRAASMGGQILAYLGQRQTVVGNKIVDISELCRRCLPEFQGNMPQNITLESTFPSYELLVNINAEQIKQVLSSIISNSVEAIGDNIGVVLFNIKSVSPSEIPTTHRFPIEWQPASDAFYACLEIRDRGCGIAQNEIEKIFDPFYSTRFVGRGLGLSVALGTIKAHDGCITVKSTPVRGTVFRLFLPLSSKPLPLQNIDKPHNTVKDEVEKSKSKHTTFDGLTMLVVEDEPMVRKISLNMLKSLGIKGVEAEDGVVAVEMFGQYKDEICCVISDLSMPRMDGWETIEALRRIKPDVKVILASGYDHSHVMNGSHSELPQAILTKPYSLTALKSTLTKVLLS